MFFQSQLSLISMKNIQWMWCNLFWLECYAAYPEWATEGIGLRAHIAQNTHETQRATMVWRTYRGVCVCMCVCLMYLCRKWIKKRDRYTSQMGIIRNINYLRKDTWYNIILHFKRKSQSRVCAMLLVSTQRNLIK